MIRLTIFAFVFSSATAFLAPAPMRRFHKPLHVIEPTANELAEVCMEDGCNLEDVHLFVSQLQKEKAEIKAQMVHLNDLLKGYEATEAAVSTQVDTSGVKDASKVKGAVDNFMQSIQRAFNAPKSSVSKNVLNGMGYGAKEEFGYSVPNI
eukprot:CAMPEP_0172624932 /NCGR_PEP_ID=MMETSP1068-20121228/140360_1 /TAXON_ID=35684 /ORGANISM="Pseudopedinella elastica, Strain CCMP716" /LENGTH=149 /DNA_ID=CAMNT_0013434073 /DNA_START=48 /DNA_END=497 /DNA_ORIENTATION=-